MDQSWSFCIIFLGKKKERMEMETKDDNYHLLDAFSVLCHALLPDSVLKRAM